MKKNKIIAALLVLAMASTFLAGCSSTATATTATQTQTSYARILERGYMTVGIDPTIENICFTDAGSDEPTGFIPDLVNGFAEQLGVTRAALSRVLNCRAAISPAMALRLEGWLGIENGGHADAWISQQASYDLWQARKAGAPKVKRATIQSNTAA